MVPIILLVALSVAFGTGETGRLPKSHSELEQRWLAKGRLIERTQSPRPYADSLYLIGTYTTSGKARDVWVEYPLAYLASDYLGVEVLDISDPTNPTLINTIDTPGQAFDIQMRDSLVYVADDYSGFQILNNLGVVGGYDTPRIARGIFVQDTFAYIVDYESLLVFNVVDPTSPSQVGSLNIDSEAAVIAIFVQGPYAYLSEPMPGAHIMWIVDISDPTSPSRAGWYIDPDYWFTPHNIYVRNSLAYVANYYNELFIINVSNPANPFRVSFAYPPVGCARDVKVSGSYAYVANYEGGLWAVDISNPGSPQTAAIYDTPGLAGGVYVDSSYVYVADYYSLHIFELIPKGVEEADFRSRTANSRLMQNRPNPFGGSTVIYYELAKPYHVSLKVYDLAGRLVKKVVEEKRDAGVHRVTWDGKDERGRDESSGVYFYRFQAGSHTETRKMALIR